MSVSELKAVDILKLIVNQESGFLFGSPWRNSEKSLGVVVPVLRKDSPKRNYKLLEEVKDKVDIKDSGRIDRAEFSSKVKEPVFIRLGTVLEGDTQERAVQHSTIIMPQAKKIMVPIRCVHASKGIRSGANFTTSGTSASRVIKCCLSSGRSQNNVWSSVASTNRATLRSLGEHTHPISGTSQLNNDDLVGTMKQISKGKNKINDIIKKIPLVEMQVGVVILDQSGVVCLECFNSNKSWKAFHNSVMKENIDVLMKEQEGNGDALFSFNEKAVPSVMKKFLKKLEGAKEKDVWKGEASKVRTFRNEKILGEYAVIENKWAYIFASKYDSKDSTDFDYGRTRVAPMDVVRRRSMGQNLDNWNFNTSQDSNNAEQTMSINYSNCSSPTGVNYDSHKVVPLYSKSKIGDVHESKLKKSGLSPINARPISSKEIKDRKRMQKAWFGSLSERAKRKVPKRFKKFVLD